MRISNHDNTVQDLFNPNPEILYSVNEPDGDASPWVEAPAGSVSVETGSPSIEWHKVGTENADTDWVGVGFLQETFTYDEFTDGGAAVGTMTFTGSIPVGAVVKQSYVTGVTGFAGDTSAALTIGDGSDADRYNTSTVDVFTTAAHLSAGAVSGTAWHTAAVQPVLTITAGSDWGAVTAGQLTVTIEFVIPG